MNTTKPILLSGNIHVDERGIIRFVNEFDFQGVKRFYQAINFDVGTIRAFHGHRKEGKYVYVSSGSALVCAVRIDTFNNPSKKTQVERYVLSDQINQILYIPPHFANGWKALSANTILIFFSTSTLKSSAVDDYRFPYDYWGADIWETKHS